MFYLEPTSIFFMPFTVFASSVAFRIVVSFLAHVC